MIDTPPTEALVAGGEDRFAKLITVVIAAVAATGAVFGFMNTLESSREDEETRMGLAAQSQASERSIQVGRIFDADFDYITSAELHAFTASELEARGSLTEADTERVIARYILQSTYGYADGYYTDTLVDTSVYAYDTVGFVDLWDAFVTYADDLQAQVDIAQAEADAHLAAASDASRRADGFMLSAVLMAVAVAVSAVALATKSVSLRRIDLVVIAVLYVLGWANLVWTFVSQV